MKRPRGKTYVGQPKTIAATARMASPFQNPSASYINIAGANRGNSKPASHLKKATAATTDHESEMSYTGIKLYVPEAA
jgi:hypothetical protein